MAKQFLVVDDSAAIRHLISLTLKEAGYEVIVSDTGRNALSTLTAEKIDMVITDLNMPEMDGIELIREIRRIPNYKFVPIIILTTEAQEEKKRQGKAAGASGWIVKPFSGEQLLQVVRKFIK